jgi:hypothetical protein
MTTEKSIPNPEGHEEFHLGDQDYEAAIQQAGRWTWDLVETKDGRSNGTGVAIALGKRRFIATAGHVISQGHSIEVVRRRGMSKVPMGFVNSRWDEDPDVGLLELSTVQAAAIPDFLEEESLLPSLDQSQRHEVLVSGFPACLHRNLGSLATIAYPGNVLSDTIPASEWPSDLAPPPCPGRDLFVT